MPKKFEPGFYWIYNKRDKEWTVAEYDGEFWTFLGNDEQFRELTDNEHVGIEIIKPTYHISSSPLLPPKIAVCDKCNGDGFDNTKFAWPCDKCNGTGKQQ